MTVYFDWEEGEELAPSYEPLLRRAVEEVLRHEGCPYEAEVDMVFTDDEEIWRANRRYRKVDRPTDVLSFPAVDFERPSDFAGAGGRIDCFNPETGELLLGDVMISLERARRQAEEYGHSLQREVVFLTVHSLLHLCGYDHMEEGERLDMERRQEEIMGILGITRED